MVRGRAEASSRPKAEAAEHADSALPPRSQLLGALAFSYDRIAALAASLMDMPAAFVHDLTTEQSWYFGFAESARGLENDLCRAVINRNFACGHPARIAGAPTHPLSRAPQRFRFFAGALSAAAAGRPAAILGVLDRKPRRFSPRQRRALADLAGLIGEQAELHNWVGSSLEAGNKYIELFENAGDIIYTHDLRGRFTAVNKTFEHITGYSRQAAAQMRITDLAAPDYRTSMLMLIADQLGGAASEPREFVIRARDGRLVDLEVRCRLVFRDGKPTGVIGFGRDVTKRRRAERTLQEAAEAVSSVTGDAAFRSLVEYLGRSLNARLAMIGRLSPGRPGGVETLGVWRDGSVRENFTYELAGTPCERVAEGELCLHPAGVQELFPEDKLLRELDAAGYLGTPLRSRGGDVMGLLAVIDGKPIDPGSVSEPTFRILAARAAAELERHRLDELLEHEARHDILTALPNRYWLQEQLAISIREAERKGSSLAVCFLDLDRFKQINDTLGHAFGDRLLQRIGERLRQSLGPGDLLGRMSGDEFVAVLSGPESAEQAVERAQRMLDALRRPFTEEGYDLFVTGSLGIALYPKDATDAPTLLRYADRAMYRAKSLGMDSLECIATEPGETGRLRLQMEAYLRRALVNQEFRLHYQPVVSMDGVLEAFEALLVWDNPVLGRVAARDFIPLAEEIGLIVPLGAWVLEKACLQARQWQVNGQAGLRIAVNVSALQFARVEFLETVTKALAASGLDPRYLELELTESLVMRNLADSVRKMEMLRAVGVGIAIDDFGTGYSSLAYLRRLPVNSLKLDKSFLWETETPTRAELPVIQTIISLAHHLGLKVTAEGVEKRAQYEFLRLAGCDRAQGHLFAEPAPETEVGHWLAAGRLEPRLP